MKVSRQTIIDWTKKYSIFLYAKKRGLEACVKFLRQVKITCNGQTPKLYSREKRKPVKKGKLITFASDKFENARKSFGFSACRKAPLFVHYRSAFDSMQQIWIETQQQSHRRCNGDRVKTMRGFGGCEGAEHFLNLRRAPVIS